jgi:hypothetical protein
VKRALRRAVGPLLFVPLGGLLAACGGGFSSEPPPPPDQTIRSYVALGDGFTAAPYTGDAAGDDGCLRSTVNYPALVADALDIQDFRDVSCTGAATTALTEATRPAKDKPEVPPQIDAVTQDTDLITLGIGIENGDLLRKVFTVCLTTPCAPGQVNGQDLLNELNQAAESLTSAVRDLQDRAPDAYIVLVGYPQIFPSDVSCDAFPPVRPDVLGVVNLAVDTINRYVQSAARQTGAAYVDVAGLSAEHGLCSEEPWVHGMNGKPGKSVAYHPLATEQRVVADQITTQVRQR